MMICENSLIRRLAHNSFWRYLWYGSPHRVFDYFRERRIEWSHFRWFLMLVSGLSDAHLSWVRLNTFPWRVIVLTLVALLCCNIKLSFIEIQLHELISLGYLAHRQMACDRYGCRRPHVSRAVLLSWL